MTRTELREAVRSEIDSAITFVAARDGTGMSLHAQVPVALLEEVVLARLPGEGRKEGYQQGYLDRFDTEQQPFPLTESVTKKDH